MGTVSGHTPPQQKGHTGQGVEKGWRDLAFSFLDLPWLLYPQDVWLCIFNQELPVKLVNLLCLGRWEASGIRGSGWKTRSCCCLIFVYRRDQNSNSKRNLRKPRNESSWLWAHATTHCTHTHFFFLVSQETVRVIFFLKGFHFTLSKYQERKIILLSQHFYLDSHLSWGGSPLKYYQVKTNSGGLYLETEQSSYLDRGDPKLPWCWGPLEEYKNHKWTFI